MITVCDRMGWTYEEYLRQPVWFVKSLMLLWNSRANPNKNGE